MKVTVSEKLQSNGSWSRPWRFPTIQLRGGGLCPGFLTCLVPSSRVTQSKVKCLWTWYCIINLINRFCISYFPYSPDSACLERRRSSYNVGAQDTLTQNMSLRSVKYKLLHSLKVFFPPFWSLTSLIEGKGHRNEERETTSMNILSSQTFRPDGRRT